MSAQASRLSIRLLGTPEILLSGAALYLNNLKARALLFYLAASGLPQSRDFLATLLWSNVASTEAHHSLRSGIYRLRQVLAQAGAPGILTGSGELLGLQPDSFQCDVLDFRRLLAGGDEASLQQAVALYRGSFMQGFSLADTPVFEEWLQLEDTRLSQECFDALQHLAGLAEARAEWPAATRHLQQMLHIDPLAENAQQRLLRSHLLQGEVGQALRQYRLFELQLRQELNLSPSPETQAIYQEALGRQRSPAVLQSPAPGSSRLHPASLPFIGRDDLIRQLLAVSQEAGAGRGITVLLQGEGGMGKSRLLDEFAARLTAGTKRWTVLHGACSPFDDLSSQGPFLEALQNTGPADLQTESAMGVPDARGQFFWSILQTVRALSHTAPLLLSIEDLQWANSSTLNLFGFLAMRLHHLPVILIGTVQRAEAIPALQRLITLSRRHGDLHLLSLTPLSLDSISELLRVAGLGPASGEALAGWLHTRSAGNPFLLTEIMAQLRTEGILQTLEDGWRLDTTRWLRWRAGFQLPETAHDLVTWRLAELAPPARQLLDVLAVSGQALPVHILRDLPGLDAEALVPLVDDLLARGLVIEPPNAALTLPHHLLRETLLHHLSNLRRRSIHRQLAEALERHLEPHSDPSLRQIAVHAVAGEDTDRARRYGLRVLADLPLEYAGTESLDFVHHLYDLLAASASPAEMALLTGVLGSLHRSLGHLERAAYWHRQNLEWAQKTGDRPAQSAAHFEMGELALMSNDYQTATQAAEAGLAGLESGDGLSQAASFDPDTLIGRGHRLLGAALAMEGSNLGAAEAELQKAVLMHRRTGNQGELCATLFELGNIAAQRGELPLALNFYDESAHAAENGHIHYYLALARNNFAYHSLLLGQPDQAQKSVTQGLKTAEAYELLAALLHLYSTQGEIHLYLAQWGQAEEAFRRGLDLAEELGSLERQAGYRGGLALAVRGQGEPDAAVRLLGEALGLIAEQGYWHLRTRLELWLAETLFEQGEHARVAQLLKQALEIAHTHQRTLLLVQAQRLQARLLAAIGDWKAADRLFAETLKTAGGLNLRLETARVQAAWGLGALEYSPGDARARARIAAARAILVECNAQADLRSLPPF